LELFEEAAALVTRVAGAAFTARAAVLALVGATLLPIAAGLVGAKTAPVERSTAPATDGVAVAPAETKVVPVEKFPALTSGRRAAVSAEAKAVK